jgi:hypothetical protein
MSMSWNDLDVLVYYKGAFGDRLTKLPGIDLARFLEARASGGNNRLLEAKLWATCRKMTMMWIAGDKAMEAERDFYVPTIQDSPALFGEDAVIVHYHLEALVLFARSALDIASRLFGELLPPPFRRKPFDSFNDLVKAIMSGEYRLPVASTFEALRDDPFSWLSFIADVQKGRSLRDKLTHQIGFPIDYMELRPWSEKESAVVMIGKDKYLPLPQFIETLRGGVVNGFMLLEQICVAPTAAHTKIDPSLGG